jgi:hypothetical protein
MEFVHQTLTWGFLLALAVPLIHLINLVRRRRVQWAAMDFLLQSHRRRKTWVWLTQLLLILARMAVIGLLVAMLAQWVTRQEWMSLLGGQATHHYVLLDDSYSMSDRTGKTTAFDRGLQVLSQIGDQAMARETQQRFTLVRFSRAAAGTASPMGGALAAAASNGAGNGSPTEKASRSSAATSPEGGNSDAKATSAKTGDAADSAAKGNAGTAGADATLDETPGELADLNNELVRSDFNLRLEEARRGLDVSELSTGPLPALRYVRDLLAERDAERAIVYVLSDFREKDWSSPTESAQLLDSLSRLGVDLQFIGCSETSQTNLGIVAIEPSEDTRAAGVPLFVNVAVKNFGRQAAMKVPVTIRTYFYDPQSQAAAEPGMLRPVPDEPPAILIDEIPAGAVVTSRVQVFFPQPGSHVVEALLPEDAVGADNRGRCVVDLPESEPVLVIDGSPRQLHAFYLESAFQPGQRANTGIRTERQTTAFLRDTTLDALRNYRAIYLLDVDRLDPRSVELLESYVRQGGGVGFFVGDQVNIQFYNEQMYRQGDGLFPIELGRSDLLPPEPFENAPDFEVVDHPIFQVFLGAQNPLLRLVTIERFMKPAEGWSPEWSPASEITARLRTREPFVVEKRLGEGRVVAFLTTLAPEWNNWAFDPSFVVTLLRLQTYLAAPSRLAEERVVGSSLELALDSTQFAREIAFVTPGEVADAPLVVRRVASPLEPDSPAMLATLAGANRSRNTIGSTARAGTYEAWPRTIAGRYDVKRYAFNVDPLEGDLQTTSATDLITRLQPAKIAFRNADQFSYELGDGSVVNRSLLLMGLLLALMLAEQLLAYSASYHPVSGVARA